MTSDLTTHDDAVGTGGRRCRPADGRPGPPIGSVDPHFVISHRSSVAEAPDASDVFLNEDDECTKMVLKP